MNALVIHESLTGNTEEAARIIVEELQSFGWDASECSSRQVDLGALQRADIVVVGTWVDGLIFAAHRPGGKGHIAALPLLANKPTYVYVTYAVNPGNTLDKLTEIVKEQHGDVRGGMTIHRRRLEAESRDFAQRVASVANVPAR